MSIVGTFFGRSARMRAVAGLFGLALTFGLGASAPARADMTPAQKQDVEAVIKEYLLNNPEILRDAMVELDRRDQAKAADEQAKALISAAPQIFNSPHQAVVGNPNGKITLVEFFDYNCPHCRNIVTDLDKLMKANPDFRVVLKDYPILTPESGEAARVAIALRNQFHGDKFWQFHLKLMTQRGLVDKQMALSLASEMGANMVQLNKDMLGAEVDTTLDEVTKLATALHADGTPTFVIGSSVIAGEQNYDQLTGLIQSMRQCGKASCG